MTELIIKIKCRGIPEYDQATADYSQVAEVP